MTSEVIVVGAGIGGVAVAIALALRGRKVRVLEQAEALREVGAGLQISANGTAVLRALGVAEDVTRKAVQSLGTSIRDSARGRLVTHVPPPAAGPTWYVHRADLLDSLVARARGLGVTIETGNCVQQYEARDDGCLLTLETGETQQADIVIAADGGQSGARQHIIGVAQPVFSHQVAWRATVPCAGTEATASATLTMGPGKHLVTYPLRNGALMNVVVVEERSDWTREGWKQTGDPEDLRERFAQFGGMVPDILGQIETAHLWALFLHPVAHRWHRGGLAVLGDAAHPTLPFMAQGACLALEDAFVLARCLTVEGAGGLSRYSEIRAPRARRVVAVAAANAHRFHLKAPLRWGAQAVLKLAGPLVAPRYDWIYGHDVTL